jgi:hypothetical protein
MSRTKIITTEDIWNITNGGEKIFQNEIGELSYTKHVKSPLRDDGSTPSFKLFKSSSGLTVGKDFGGSGWSGNGISLIMEKYSLSFQQAIDKIYKDFNGQTTSLSKIKFEKKEKKIKKEDFWEVQTKPFTDKHREYFDKLELDEKYLNENDVFALDKWAINKAIQHPVQGEQYSFVYFHRDIQGNLTNRYKILRLGKHLDPKLKWRTNVFNHLLWNTHKIPKDCETLWIVKSYKDCLLLQKHFGFNCIATNNESATILLENNYDFLENISKKKVICYGVDFQGWHESYLITYLTGWDYWNTPNNLYSNFELEDPSDVISNFGVNTLRNLLKKKGWL